MKKFFVAIIAVMLLGAVAGLTACGETQCDHNYEEDTARTVAATCHSDGTKYMVCSKCGDEKTENITNRPNHVFTGEWVKVDNDVHARKCANCDAVNTQTEAHDFVADSSKTDVAATCHSDGTRYLKCSDCGTEKTEAITDRPAHNYGEGEDIVWVKVDETNHAKQCKTTGCGYVDNTQTEAHDFVADSSKTDVAATCHSDGTRYLKCSDCGAEKEETDTNRPAHNYGEGEEVVWVKVDETNHAMQCINDGCDYIDTDNKVAHTYSGTYESDDNEHWRVCDVCGNEERSAHDWDEVTVQPTFWEDGSKTSTCTVCEKISEETLPAKTATTYKEGFTTESVEGKPAGDWCYGSVDYKFGEKEDFTFEQFTAPTDVAWKYDNADPEQHVEIKDGYINASGKWAAVGFTFKADMTATINFKFTGTIPKDDQGNRVTDDQGNEIPQSKFNCRIGVKNAEGVIYGNPEFRGGEVCEYTQTIEFKAGDTVYFMMEHEGTGWSSGTLEITVTNTTNTQGA